MNIWFSSDFQQNKVRFLSYQKKTVSMVASVGKKKGMGEVRSLNFKVIIHIDGTSLNIQTFQGLLKNYSLANHIGRGLNWLSHSY